MDVDGDRRHLPVNPAIMPITPPKTMGTAGAWQLSHPVLSDAIQAA
jgi:hypothetical protein